MKFFIDSAKIEEIREGVSMGLVDGVTTNPSLMAKAGKGFEEIVREIVKVVDGPISVEAVSSTAPEMVEESKALARIHKNIVVKIPCSVEGLKAVRELERAGVRTNVTLVFSVNQALLAAKAGASFVSPFVGRLDDAGEDGMAVVEGMVKVFKNYGFKSEVIVASIRKPEHVLRAALCGAHIATIPFEVMKQLSKHPLTDAGIKKFLEDWEKVKQEK